MEETLDHYMDMAYNAVAMDPEHVYSYVRERFSVAVKTPEEMRQLDVEVIDTAADDLIRSSKVDAAMSGMILGGGGALSIPLDVLSLMTSALRLTQKVAIVYGFGVETEEEKAAVWISLAQATGIEEIDDGTTRRLLSTIPSMMQNSPYRKVVVFKLLREILTQLPARISRGGLGRMMPIVGGFVGALGNFRYLQEVGATAKIRYRDHHVKTFRSA